MNKTVYISGSNGQLGLCFRALQHTFPALDIYFTTRDELDLFHINAIEQFFEDHPMDVFINCAAYTAVDKAEAEPSVAFQVNHIAPSVIAQQCKKHHIILLHYSTDYVYHSSGNIPLKESFPCMPESVYGKSKLQGEQAIIKTSCNYLILRTSWLYSQFANNFLKTMLHLIQTKNNLNVVFDQIGTPTNAEDLARVSLDFIKNHPLTPFQEIVNFSNIGVASWYDFAQVINSYVGNPCDIQAIETKDFPRPAPRPHYSVFNLSKLKHMGYIPDDWRRAVTKTLAQLEN